MQEAGIQEAIAAGKMYQHVFFLLQPLILIYGCRNRRYDNWAKVRNREVIALQRSSLMQGSSWEGI